MANFPTLIIGGLTISPLRRLPQSKKRVAPTRAQVIQRSQNGTLFIQRLFSKYSIPISGVAQTLFEDLRYIYEQDDPVDLYAIVNRKELLTITGLTNRYTTSRRIRIDENPVKAIVEYPEGVVMASSQYTITNTSSQGVVTFNSVLASGTNAVIRYFPIIKGYITDFNDSSYDWTTDEETYAFNFEEL